MQGTWRKARNGWVVVDVHGDEYVAENTMALLPIFEGMRREGEGERGREGESQGTDLLTSMRGAALSIVKSEEEIAGELLETWEPEESPEWPATLESAFKGERQLDPGTSTNSGDVNQPTRAEPEEPVTYVAATEDGYEFPAVRGPLNGRREIKCPSHGWQTAVVKDGAYRCQFKPSPRQVCQEPGAPKEEAEKRLVPA